MTEYESLLAREERSRQRWRITRVVIAVLAIIAVVAGIAWREWRYPCLESEAYECRVLKCKAYNSNGTCSGHYYDTTTCHRCIQRGDRYTLPSEVP